MKSQRPGLTATKPTPAQADPADRWVKTRGHGEPMIRMTFDLDPELHHLFTVAAAKRRVKLTAVLRESVAQFVADTEKLP